MGLIRQIGLIGKRGVALPIILLIALSVPSFWRMLKPGIFSMHDFHVFRLFEFHKCVLDLQIPCRWTPDASFGWGQPLFNFYNQLVYVFGEPFLLLGFQVIDTIKILFILSLVLSAVSMFFLARQMWGSALAGFLSALLYVYAPYRAVDVWVRGALPEAFAFVFYPLIILFFNRFILTEKAVYLFWFTVFLSCLLLVHNLSFLMFSVLFVFWAGFYLTVKQGWHLWKYFLPSGFLVLGISSFYLLPVVFESKLVSLGDITGGYYNFQIHFVSLKQLFWDRTWGYAASQWLHDEELSLSAGHVQWVLSIVIFAFALRRKQLEVLVLFVLGWFFLFLTHGKSLFIWETFPFLSFVQFPWRFLSLAVFSFALLGGSLVLFLTKEFLKKGVVIFLGLLTILVNFSFFREDIWYSISDHDEFSGERWDWHRSSAVSDFWPKYAKETPTEVAPNQPIFASGEGSVLFFQKKSNIAMTRVVVESDSAELQFPVVYFDGWRGYVDGKPYEIYYSGDLAQIALDLSKSKREILLKFENTWPRRLGNIISLFSLIIISVWGVRIFGIVKYFRGVG